MKIITKIYNDDDEIMGKIESLSFESHEENLHKIEQIAETLCKNCEGTGEYEVGENDDCLTKKCMECHDCLKTEDDCDCSVNISEL